MSSIRSRDSFSPAKRVMQTVRGISYNTESGGVEFEDSSLQCGLTYSPVTHKIFQDPVHGPLRLDPLLVCIIDTPQYQRLRDIKQLGASYWVFPGACHNRFEHGIGTSYLCGLLISTLRDLHLVDYRDPIDITDTEILCVKIAGLCHDLGHGPFSHAFDMNYVKTLNPECTWSHESASCEMFDYMLQENPSLREKFAERSLSISECDFIKRLILGRDPRRDDIPDVCVYHGQLMQKWFLYEIVANKRTGIDCDKFDYLARDSHFVGIKTNFDCLRFFQNLRVIAVDGQLQICVRDKEVFNLYELFHVRWTMHRQVYQHKTTKCIEQMLAEAMLKVDKKFEIAASVKEMSRYLDLTDSVFYQILGSKDHHPSLIEAQQLLRRIQVRDLYKFCGQLNPSSDRDHELASSQLMDLDADVITDEMVGLSADLHAQDIFVSIVDISFGMGGKNPVDSVVFFSKNGQPMLLRADQISALLPKIYREQYVRVYSRTNEKRHLVESCFSEWCLRKGFRAPNVLDELRSRCFTSIGKNKVAQDEQRSDRMTSVAGNKRVRRTLVLADLSLSASL